MIEEDDLVPRGVAGDGGNPLADRARRISLAVIDAILADMAVRVRRELHSDALLDDLAEDVEREQVCIPCET